MMSRFETRNVTRDRTEASANTFLVCHVPANIVKRIVPEVRLGLLSNADHHSPRLTSDTTRAPYAIFAAVRKRDRLWIVFWNAFGIVHRIFDRTQSARRISGPIPINIRGNSAMKNAHQHLCGSCPRRCSRQSAGRDKIESHCLYSCWKPVADGAKSASLVTIAEPIA